MRNKHPITKDEPQENINRRSTILSRDYWVLTIHILAQKFGIDDIIDWKVDWYICMCEENMLGYYIRVDDSDTMLR